MQSTPSSTAVPGTAPARVRSTVAALVADAAIVMAFAATGRATHGESDPVLGALTTAWPFALGLAVAWVLPLVHRRPLAVWPAGVLVWLGTYAIGMMARTMTGQGTAVPFLIVAASVLGVALVGWRAVALGVRAAQRARRER